ncbi:hypothetical protein Fuma_06257 [Fuerstiella marisgermanici]|uniref:Uncharacterized protein n=1 Tax=Fuerstiella marisgermanici TaxID=1891926 RepID=A0A1P8WRA1_9PLAN|nr:hypothetical protein Fuma_06257 [Fuerstiella marisgermanici]
MPSLPENNDTQRQSQVLAKAQKYQWRHLSLPSPSLALMKPLARMSHAIGVE